MAVAEKTVAERASRSPQRELAVKSLLGALYVLFSLGMIFSGIPWLWEEYLAISTNQFLSGALLLLVLVAAMIGLFFLGRRLERMNPPHGLRAGIFVVCVSILLITWIAVSFGSLLSTRELDATVGAVLTIALAAGLIFAVGRVFLKPGFARWLGEIEDQGWFHAIPYKPNQGVRVRRGTMLALLTLGVCGIITMISHRALGSDRFAANDWELLVPFTNRYVPLMFSVHYTVPLVLAVLLIWVSWRVVNWPVFGDFLIATEAEMNKVSWTTRRRLFQDTIVVLVTVVLLTVFLFVVDLLWIHALSFVQVLRVDVRAEQLKQQEKSPW